MKAVTLNRDGQRDITSSHSRKMRRGVHLEDFQQDKNLSEITFKTKKTHILHRYPQCCSIIHMGEVILFPIFTVTRAEMAFFSFFSGNIDEIILEPKLFLPYC